MASTDQDTAKLLTRRFYRSGASGSRLRALQDFDRDAQSRILSACAFETDELPILAQLSDDKFEFVVTTRRIIWQQDDRLIDIPLSEIDNVSIDAISVVKDRETIDKIDRIQIFRGNNKKHKLHVESGFPFGGFWGVLSTIVRMNSKN